MGIKRIWKTEEVFHLPDGDLRYYGHLGIPHYEEMDDGSVQASMPVTHALLNGHGTVQGDRVLDPFAGSGTTIVACEQLGRRAYCMELDGHYAAVIVRRWESLTGKKAVQI